MSQSVGAVGERTSVLLADVLANLPDTDITIDDILTRLRRRSFGGLLILLAALGLIPGISVLAGLAMIIPGLQMAVGFQSPSLPRFVGQRTVGTRSLRQLGDKGVRFVQRCERFAMPRWLFMTSPIMVSLIGLLVTALAMVIMVPLPFSNLAPAVALFVLALGILERDGILIAVGVLLAAIALAIGGFVAYVAVESVMPVLAPYFQ